MKQALSTAKKDYLIPTSLGDLHVTECGRGQETIVLWPSIFTDHHIYDAVTEFLGDRYRFLLIDGPAHGISPGTSREFSMQDCGQSILTVLDHFGLKRAVLGGTSWGGLASAQATLAASDRVKALILMNTPMGIDGARPGISARMITAGARCVANRAFFQNGVAKSFFSQSVIDKNPRYMENFHKMLSSADQSKLAIAIRSVILRGTPLKFRMAHLKVPVMVIAGKSDAMYPIEDQAECALLAPQGYFEPVDGKHISVVEEPERISAIIDQFMTEVVCQ